MLLFCHFFCHNLLQNKKISSSWLFVKSILYTFSVFVQKKTGKILKSIISTVRLFYIIAPDVWIYLNYKVLCACNSFTPEYSRLWEADACLFMCVLCATESMCASLCVVDAIGRWWVQAVFWWRSWGPWESRGRGRWGRRLLRVGILQGQVVH